MTALACRQSTERRRREMAPKREVTERTIAEMRAAMRDPASPTPAIADSRLGADHNVAGTTGS